MTAQARTDRLVGLSARDAWPLADTAALRGGRGIPLRVLRPYTRPMPSSITTIRNLGPASAKSLAKAGIDSAETLRALGPDAAYARLLASGAKPHFIGYYAIVMGLMGRPWNDCRGAEKAALRTRFDAILAEATPTAPQAGADPALERLLDEVGLPTPRPVED